MFGAKAFPGYEKSKTIIKFIGEIEKLINNDAMINNKIKVVFVENYRVTYAEKLIPAADVSKQISTTGKEASGIGNMKFMLNGAPTFGTYDGTNVEIVRESGIDNNFISGLRVEDIVAMKESYDAKEYYHNNEDIKRVVDWTFSDGGTGEFRRLYDSLIKGENWHKPDQYYVLADFGTFKQEQDKVFEAYKDTHRWAKMCLMNIANAGNFSSDRTIMEYANEIWHITPITI